jgi:hypothetical protein
MNTKGAFGSKSIFAAVILAILGQVAFLLAAANSFNFFSRTSAQTSASVQIALKIGDSPTTSGMTISGTEILRAAVSPTVITSTIGESLALSTVSFYLDNPDTSDVNPDYGLGAYSNDGVNFTSSDLPNYTFMANGTYNFYAKAFYGNPVSYAYPFIAESDHYAINLNRAVSYPASTPIISPAPTLALTPTPTTVTVSYPVIVAGINDAINGSTVSGTRILTANSNLSLASVIFKLHNTTSNTLDLYAQAAAIPDSANKNWSASFDTTRLPNGNYSIVAKGLYNSAEHISNYVYFTVNNATAFNPTPAPSLTLTPTPATAATPAPTFVYTPAPTAIYTPAPIFPTLTPTPAAVTGFAIKTGINEYTFGAAFGGVKSVYAESVSLNNVALLESLTFYFINSADAAKIISVPGISNDRKTWRADFSSVDAPNGNYDFFAKGWYKENYYRSAVINIKVYNSANDTTAVSNPVLVKFVESFYAPIFGDKKIAVILNQEPDSVRFIISGPKNSEAAAVKGDAGNYYFIWKTAEFPDGYYTIKAVARKFSHETFASVGVSIGNNYLSASSGANATYQIGAVGPECAQKGFFTEESCRKYLEIPWECRQKSILNSEACKEYMFRYAMPEDCRYAGAQSQEECSRIIIVSSEKLLKNGII